MNFVFQTDQPSHQYTIQRIKKQARQKHDLIFAIHLSSPLNWQKMFYAKAWQSPSRNIFAYMEQWDSQISNKNDCSAIEIDFDTK